MRSLAALAMVLVTACGDRTADIERDFSEDVERICASMCARVMECRVPPLFETSEACEASCAMPGFMYDDSPCGEALRDYIGCIGSTQSCAEYLDTLEVDADVFTCQQEGAAFAALKCGAEGN